MSELIKLIDQDMEETLPNVYISGGMKWAIKFAELLIPQLQGTNARVSISGWGTDVATGFFFHDEIHGLAVRVGTNADAGCGRLHRGKSEDFEFPSRLPKEYIQDTNCDDFDDSDLVKAVEFAVAFFTCR